MLYMSGESTPCLQVCGHSLEEVTKFTYLGSVQSTTGRCQPDIVRRIGIASILPCTLWQKSGDRPGFTCRQNFACTRLVYYSFCCTVRRHGHFCRKIYGSSRSSTCVPSVWSSGYAGMTLSETQKSSTGPAFPVFAMSSPGDETHCSAMWWDSMTTRQLTAHYHRSQQQEPAPVLVLRHNTQHWIDGRTDRRADIAHQLLKCLHKPWNLSLYTC